MPYLQVTYPKTDEQRQRLQEACSHILMFKNVDPVSRIFPNARVVLALPSPHLHKEEHSLRSAALHHGSVHCA